MDNSSAVLDISRTNAIDYARELNSQQLHAVTRRNGHYLVIAGAGSGKTRTLVYRVAYLIEQGVDPQAILLLTFTRKAAQEMMNRAVGILDQRCQKIVGGTFHAYAYRVLREYARHIGYADPFTVMDTADAESLLKMVLNEPEFADKKKQLPKAAMLASLISRAANTGLSLGAAIANLSPQFVKKTTVIAEIGRHYCQHKRQKSLMDFDDLLLYLKQLLQEQRSIGQELAQAHHYIMVDEYQDTNRLQAEIVALLARAHGNLMAVGDDSQSIYSFRGANFKNIMAFPQMFSDCQVIMLEQNYRSTQPILSFSNAVLDSVREKYSKRLFSDITGDHKPLYLRPKDEEAEARLICQAIAQLCDDGVDLGDIAVLFRAASHAHYLEIELARQQLPFVKYGGIKFAEASHVKDVLALLKMLQNPLDAVAWQRILVLLDGLGAKTAMAMIHEVVELQTGYAGLLAAPFSGKKYSPTLTALWQIIQEFQASPAPLPEKMAPLLDFYAPLLASNYENAKSRQQDLATLAQMATGYRDVEQFLADLALEPPEVEAARDKSGQVVLSTVHSAKGLEWHTVFVIHLLEGLFPSCYALDNDEILEEERRLFYVAVTRARKNLCLLTPQIIKNGKLQYIDPRLALCTPSRFVTENDELQKLILAWQVE